MNKRDGNVLHEKLEGLRDIMTSIGIDRTKNQATTPSNFH